METETSEPKKKKVIMMSVDDFGKSLDPPKSRLTIYKWIRNIKAWEATKKGKKKNPFPKGSYFHEYLPGKYVIKVRG